MAYKILTLLYLSLITGGSGKYIRIIEGQNSQISEFPYIVSIRISDLNKHVCAGAIISHHDILTAAHCVYKKDKYYSRFKIYAGTSFLSDAVSVFKIRSIHIHPGFYEKFKDSNDFLNDIAILKTREYIPFNDFQNKINLPTHDVMDDSPVTIIGWGKRNEKEKMYSNRLQKATVKIMKYSQCSKHFPFPLLFDQICTHSDVAGTCNGDSGGPVIRNGKIVGIVSYAIDCLVHRPDLQINVFTHIMYIRSIMDKNN